MKDYYGIDAGLVLTIESSKKLKVFYFLFSFCNYHYFYLFLDFIFYFKWLFKLYLHRYGYILSMCIISHYYLDVRMSNGEIQRIEARSGDYYNTSIDGAYKMTLHKSNLGITGSSYELQ